MKLTKTERDVGPLENPERHLFWSRTKFVRQNARRRTGQHTLWAYCHVPFDSKIDMSERIESQIDASLRVFAIAFWRVIKRARAELEKSNPNLAGGDIKRRRGKFVAAPRATNSQSEAVSHTLDGVYLCSSSTPPGGRAFMACAVIMPRALRCAICSISDCQPIPRAMISHKDDPLI